MKVSRNFNCFYRQWDTDKFDTSTIEFRRYRNKFEDEPELKQVLIKLIHKIHKLKNLVEYLISKEYKLSLDIIDGILEYMCADSLACIAGSNYIEEVAQARIDVFFMICSWLPGKFARVL